MNELEHIGGFKMLASRLKEILSLCSCIDNEAKFVLDAEGLTYQAVDSSHVAMLQLNVPLCPSENDVKDSVEFGINIKRIQSLLKNSKKTDLIEMELEVRERKNVTKPMEIIRETVPVFRFRNMRYRAECIDLGGITDPNVPTLALPCTIEVNMSLIRDAMIFAGYCGDHIIFTARREGKHTSFDLESWSDDLLSENLTVNAEGAKVEFSKKCEEKNPVARSIFPLDYMLEILKVIKSPLLKIKMANDYPCKLSAYLQGGEGSFSFLLAPRIETENSKKGG